MCRQLELGRKTKILLYVCFIDLQKVNDSVDRELLREALARFGVPQKMIAVILQVHNGMRAFVRRGDDECSTWLYSKANKGYDKGMCCHRCASTHFSRLCYTSSWCVFIEDEGVMANLVHLEEGGVGGETGWSGCVPKAVWSMLYAAETGVLPTVSHRKALRIW